MKTLRNVLSKKIKRTNDKEARGMVASKEWGYCSKEEWKAEVRDLNKKDKKAKEVKEVKKEEVKESAKDIKKKRWNKDKKYKKT